jgi:tetratricopeptide (TPR) repeat protein
MIPPFHKSTALIQRQIFFSKSGAVRPYNERMRGNWCARGLSLFFAAVLCHAADSHWIHLRSANFEMCTTAGARSALDTIREFEQVRGFFLGSFGGEQARRLPVTLIAFSSPKEFEPYRINDFAIAYYQSAEDRDYIVMSHAGADTFSVAVHEYVHLVVRHAGLNFPPWLNEGLAELYSTLKPYGGKILVGDLIPGRFHALLQDKWIPLATILEAGRDSPYYNEKDKAGSLYNEGWALTHMLCFRSEYRPSFGKLLRTISGGKDSAEAFSEVYGKTVAQVEKDLQAYLHGTTFQGSLVGAKLDKVAEDIPVEPLAEFDTNLLLADLTYRPGKEAEHQAALARLVEQDPKRPEPYRRLGYLAWRAGKTADAIERFGKAFELGDRNSKMLFDYGRLLESPHPDKAAPVLAELLAQDKDRMDVRLELAETYLRAENTSAAIMTLAPIKAIAPADTTRYFRLAVTADLRSGNRAAAEAAARHYVDLAKSDTDKAAAQYLLSLAEPPAAAPTPTSDATPEAPRPVRPARLTAEGQFVELDCRAQQPRMIVETATGRKVFLIDDSNHVAIVARNAGPVDMACGPQKPPAKVTVGYEPAHADQTGIDGLVRSLTFQ